MESYFTGVQTVETPLYEDEYTDYEDYFPPVFIDPAQTVKQRMLFILAVVAIVAATLGFLTFPATGQSAARTQTYELDNVVPQPDSVVGSAQETTELLPSSGQIANLFTPEVQYWESNIVSWASEHGVDPNAVATIMQIESCGDPQAVSVAGAQGLFQVMPFHFSNGENMLDPDTNARRGMNFLNEQLRYTGGDIFLSFAGYNGGYAASGGDYANWASETQRYYNWAKGIYEDASGGLERSETLETWLAAGGAAGCQRAADRLGLN